MIQCYLQSAMKAATDMNGNNQLLKINAVDTWVQSIQNLFIPHRLLKMLRGAFKKQNLVLTYSKDNNASNQHFLEPE